MCVCVCVSVKYVVLVCLCVYAWHADNLQQIKLAILHNLNRQVCLWVLALVAIWNVEYALVCMCICVCVCCALWKSHKTRALAALQSPKWKSQPTNNAMYVCEITPAPPRCSTLLLIACSERRWVATSLCRRDEPWLTRSSKKVNARRSGARKTICIYVYIRM